MLELLGKDFKVVLIIMINGIKDNMLTKNEMRKPLSRKIENIEKDPNGKF